MATYSGMALSSSLDLAMDSGDRAVYSQQATSLHFPVLSLSSYFTAPVLPSDHHIHAHSGSTSYSLCTQLVGPWVTHPHCSASLQADIYGPPVLFTGGKVYGYHGGSQVSV